MAQADPLVSGYGGPGSGDQEVLGATLLPARPGGGNSGDPDASGATGLRARPAAAPATAAVPAPAADAVSMPQANDERSDDVAAATTPRRKRLDTPVAKRREPATPEAAVTVPSTEATPAVVRSPGAATSAGALPMAGDDLVIALFVVAGLGLAAFASARLASRRPTPA